MRWSLQRDIGRAFAPPIIALMLLGNIAATHNLPERTLSVQNDERAKLGIKPLKWDKKLALSAEKWAKHLAVLGRLEHYPNDDADPDPEGENLWAGTAGHYSIEAMSQYWAAEKRHYKLGLFPNSSTTGDLEDVGHYTQMVWRSSTRIGCALVTGESDDFFVCRYGEGGNVIGEVPY
ncbi:MAG: CAP domain-containing protein [Pseudomonadota bacterium]